jgi:DNA-binding transcriptional LysR family regulator
MERRGRLTGPLCVDASTPFMLHVLVPLMRGYRERHPGVELTLSTEEGFIDLLERKVDVAIRIGEMKDSTLHRRLLGHTRVRLFASPGYLGQRGAPADADALGQHDLLGFSHPDTLKVWSLVTASGVPIHVQPTLMTTSGETQRQLAIQGMGIALMSEFMTAEDVAQGRLVEVLPHATQHSRKPVNAVYYKQSAVSARIASMVDYLVAAMAGPECHWFRGPEKQKPTG